MVIIGYSRYRNESFKTNEGMFHIKLFLVTIESIFFKVMKIEKSLNYYN